MEEIDLNLLTTLNALLRTGSVSSAAKQLGVSTSVVSRCLARLRTYSGDPLLVRAGGRLVPTAHAFAIQDRVRELTHEVHAVLRGTPALLDPASIHMDFTIRAGEWFMEMLAVAIIQEVEKTAPRVRLRFVPKHEADPAPLRDGSIDLEIGKRGTSAPEVRSRFLFHDRYVGIARRDHPLIAAGPLSRETYAAAGHVMASQTGEATGPVDKEMKKFGLTRTVQVVVPSYPDAMRVASQTDLLGIVPQACLRNAIVGDRTATMGLVTFKLPLAMPKIALSAMWHPRKDSDPSHRWLRATVVSVCKQAHPE